MADIEIILVPELRRSAVKAVSLLQDMSGLEVILLDLPETLEKEIGKLAAYEMTHEELVRKIRQERLLPEPLENWTYLTEPVLRALPRLKLMRPELEVSGLAALRLSALDLADLFSASQLVPILSLDQL